MISISEIFFSIQGEGPNMGYPAIFLRTAGCNLRCTWCDTPYALELRQGNKTPHEEILEKIKSFPCRHIVLTGGEPMIQQRYLKELLSYLDGYFVEVETNGGFSSEIDEYVDQYNCSPKLIGSGNKPYELKLLPNDKTWYKFVIDNEKDFEDTLSYIDKYQLPKSRVRLMPQTRNFEEDKDKNLWLVELCKQHGFIFNPRLHVMLWGNIKGK